MKTDRKIQAEKKPSTSKAGKGKRRAPAKTRSSNGKRPSVTYEHAQIGIVETSLEGNYIHVNEEFCRILGYERDELLRRGIKDFTHEDDYSIDIRLHEDLISEKIPFYRLEKRYLRKDGTSIWVELTRSLIRDAKGKPLYTVGVVLDISDRKDVERVLRESVERLRLATEAAQMFMWEWDFQHQIYTLADNFEQVLGFSAGLLPKNHLKTIGSLIPEEDVQRIVQAYEQAIKTHSDLHSLPCRVIHSQNGQIVWLEISAKIVYDEQGNPVRMFGVAQNITENKKTLDQIAIISRFPGENPNPVMRLAPSGEVLYANSPGLGLLQAWKQQRDQAVPVELQKAVTEAFTSGLRQEIDIHYEEKVFSCTIAPILEAGYVNFYGNDITERKRAEAALQLASRRAEQSADRTARLQKVTAALSAALTPPQVAEVLANQGALAFGAVSSSVVLLSEDGQTLEMMYSNASQSITGPYKRFPVSLQVPAADAARSGQPIWLESRQQYLERYPHLADQINLWGQQAAIVVPMVYKERILGVITLSLDRVLAYNLEDLDYALTLARQGAQALERARAEDALRESEERFRALVSQATAGITETDMDSALTFVNPRFCEMLGYSESELLGKTIWELTYPDDLEENKRLFDKMLTHSESYQFEKRLIRRDGSTLWTSVSVSTIRDLAGNPKGGVGVILDIDERKQAEQALAEFAREQAALYRFVDQLHRTVSFEDIYNAGLDAILSGLPCDRAAILLFDQMDVMRFVAWRGLSDMYRQATDGHSPWTPDLVDPQPVVLNDVRTAELSDSLRGVIQQEGIGSLAFIPLVSNGKLIGKFMVYFNAPHQFDEGEIDLGLTIARQLASGIERKRTEEALRLENERFMRFISSNIVGILIGNDQGEVILANDYYLNLLGVSRQDFMEGKLNWREFTPPEWLPADERAIQELRERGVCEPYEKEYVRTDGTRVPVYIADALLPGPGKEIAAFVLDITERKRAEEALRRNEELFSTLVETAPFGVYFIDSEFRLRAINKGSQAVFGGIDPLIGRDFAEILRIVWQEPFATEAIELFRHTLRTGESFISPPIIEPRANIDEIQSYDWQIHRITMPDGTFGVVCYFYDLSEQKRMEAAVRASEALYRAIARSIPGGGVYVVDKDFRYLVAEGPVTEAFGLSRETLEGHTVAEAFPGEQGERMEERLQRNFAGETISFETKHNGRVYWTRQAPLLDSIGHAVVVTMDITERKQAEEALRQSEERFALFMQHLPGLAWIKDMQGRYVYANAAAEKAFGTPQERLYGRTDEDVFPADVAAQFKQNDEQALNDGKGVQVVETLEQDDGILHYSLVSKFPIPGPDGNAALIGGTAFDITERLRAEEALRESEERFRAILRQATAGIVRKDAEGRLIYVNQAFCNMLGYTESELLGRTIWELMHEDDVAENQRSYNRMMMEGIPFKLEKRLIREDGSVIWVDASVSPIMDAEGRPQSAVAVEVDITGRKQAEEALQQLNLQLEERVLSRTAKLRAVNQTLRDEIAERKRVEDALRKSEAIAHENETKLGSLFELLPVGISFLNLNGQIIQMNAALLHILKLSKEQFLNQAYRSRKYIRPDGTPMPSKDFASARAIAEQRTVYNVETGIVLENGDVIWTSVSAAPVNVADVSVVVVTVDITETKRAEQALQESHARLRILSQRLVEVQEDERRALARELHDRVGQTLAALNINLIIINSQLSADGAEQIGTRLNDSMKLVAETISLVRDVMTDLRPAVLDDYGLEAAIDSHLSQFISRYDIQARFEKSSQPIPRLGSSIEMTFLRIAQEALMNIARHAQATQVNLSLWQEEDAICMTIQDNGVGIQSWQEANRPGSHGLTIMRERAEAFGGTLQVRSIPGQGTRIDVSIPLKEQNQRGEEAAS